MLKKFFKSDYVAPNDLQPEIPWQYCEPMADDIGALAVGSDDESFPLERTIVGVLAEITEQGFVFMAPYESSIAPSITVKHALVRRRAPIAACDGCESGACEQPLDRAVASSPRDAVLVEKIMARYTDLIDKIDQALVMFRLGLRVCGAAYPAVRELHMLSQRIEQHRELLRSLR